MVVRFLGLYALLFCTLILRLGHAQEIIPHSVGIYLSPKGQEFIGSNIEELFFRNGITIDSAYFPTVSMETEEQSLEDMFENQDDLRELVEKIKDNISRYFIGLDLDKHKFKIDAHEIEFFAEWSELQLSFLNTNFPEFDDQPSLSFHLYVEASRVQLNVAKVDFIDVNHPFLGEYGIDHAELSLDEEYGEPLYLGVTAHIFNRGGQLEIQLEAPQSNISEVKFRSNFRPPLRMPVIEIRINDHVVQVNQPEVEALFREKQEDIFRVAQEEAQNWLDKEAQELISAKINEVLQNNELIDVNQMDSPGAPEGSNPPKFEWGLTLAKLGFHGDLVHLGLDGFVRDPVAKTTPILARHLISRTEPNLANESGNGHDMFMSLNQGFVNKIIQLSAERGYFRQVDLDNGDVIPMTKTPELILNGRGRPSLGIEIEYRVTGAQALFVRNPIRLSFNLLIDFEVDSRTGRTQLVGKGVDIDSLHLDDRYIRMFAGRVRSAARDTLRDMQKDLDGMVIVDEFPIPDSLFGLSLSAKRARMDQSGHMIIYINFDEDLGF